MWIYKVKAGPYQWDVYRRSFLWPWYEMFPVASFDRKSDAERWIKEQG